MYRDEGFREIRVLLVEDNPADVRLIQEGFSTTRARYRLQVVDDGEKAVEFMQRRGVFMDAQLPDLVLLDLNLPKKSGVEVLGEIKSDPRLRRIPIIVLTSSRFEKDVNTAYDRGANAYMRKPSNLEQIYALAKVIEECWLNMTVLPSLS